jgi:HK97 family phage prohead protease
MPLEAREDDHGLYLAGRFHATPTAQEARTIARERIDAGLRVGLSIGYGVEDFAPVSLPGGRRGRILKTIYPLHEVGLVMVPMNRAATISSIKSLDPTCQDDRCLLAALAAAEAERGVAEVLAQARRLGVPV